MRRRSWRVTPSDFSKRMARLGTNVAKNADKVVRKVAMAIDQAVVMATPVDTGRARANWIAALNGAAEGTTDDKSKSGGSAIAKAAGVIAGYDRDKDAEIHITNNLPYIGRLNEGSSYQAPANFVSIATRQGVKAVKGAKLLED
jgi:hypothetical protein